MTADDGFGAALERLAVGKRIDLAAAVQPAGARREVEDVLLRGTSPGPGLLRVLAPVLGWHAADVFALAGVPVPDDLGPTGRLTGRWVTDVIRSFVVLGPERQATCCGSRSP